MKKSDIVIAVVIRRSKKPPPEKQIRKDLSSVLNTKEVSGNGLEETKKFFTRAGLHKAAVPFLTPKLVTRCEYLCLKSCIITVQTAQQWNFRNNF